MVGLSKYFLKIGQMKINVIISLWMHTKFFDCYQKYYSSYPKSTRNIHKALSIQCLPSSVMYLSPWPLEASQYSFSCNESLIVELRTDVLSFLPVENILYSFSPRPSMTFFSDPSMILFLSSLAFCATSSCCFRQSWHALYHCCSNCPFPGLIDK